MDTYGRKKVFAIGSFVNFITLSVIICLPYHRVPSLNIIYAFQFINGIASSARIMTGYNYFTEFYPESMQCIVGTTWNVIEGCIVIFITIFFMFISKEWNWIITFAAI